MNYSFVDCDEVLLKAIGEIRPLLNFDISKDGIPVKLRRTTKGLAVKKTKQDEIREIDDYVKLFGMELIPCVQTLAHMNQITKYESYDSIIDNTDILLTGYWR